MLSKRVLFVRFSSLGDIITSNYYAMKIKQKHPEWHLTWLADSQYAPLVRMQPWVDAVLEWDRKKEGNRGFLKVLHTVRAKKFDILIDMHGSDRTAFFTLCSGIPEKYGPKHAWIPIKLYDSNDFSLLMDGVDEMYLCPKYLFAETSEKKINALVRNGAETVLILAIGASFKKKRWPIQSWIAFCRLCAAKGWRAVLVGSGEEEAASAREIVDAAGDRNVIDLVGKLSVLELVQTIDAGDIMVAGDTGPLHIARALGIKTIGLFGPTLVEKNYMAHLSQVFYSDCEHVECENWDCGKPCLETILPQTVFTCAERLLQKETTRRTFPE